jgi:hypothetical protein
MSTFYKVICTEIMESTKIEDGGALTKALLDDLFVE